MTDPFPTDWSRALVLMPHPDDPETGIAAAVAKWTSMGRSVRYILACRGEAGIAGMPPDEAGPLREAEQRRAAAIVGVDDVEFWDEPDGAIRDTAALRRRISETLQSDRPDVVITLFGGSHWGPGVPNHPDHVEFAAAVRGACAAASAPPRWLFASALQATHVEAVEDFLDAAHRALAAHERYFAVLDPTTPVPEQVRQQLERTLPRRADCGNRRAALFQLIELG